MDIDIVSNNGQRWLEFLNNKKVLLMSVCKDTVTFLKMYNDNKTTLPFKVIGVVDFTLDIRTGVRSRIESVLHNIPLIETWDDFTNILKDGILVIQFESPAYRDVLIKETTDFDFDLFDSTEFISNIKQDCTDYVSTHGKEWNFRVREKYVTWLNDYMICTHDLYLMQSSTTRLCLNHALNAPISDTEQELRHSIRVIDRLLTHPEEYMNQDIHHYPYDIEYKAVRDQVVHFVFSTDFAGGKTTYIYLQDHDMLLPDQWCAFFDREMFYSYLDAPDWDVPCAIHKALCRREYTKGHENDIFIKMEGNLLSYVYAFLERQSKTVDLQHIFSFFHNYTVDIIHKETETYESIEPLITEFCKMHFIDMTKVRLITNHNNSEYFTIDEV